MFVYKFYLNYILFRINFLYINFKGVTFLIFENIKKILWIRKLNFSIKLSINIIMGWEVGNTMCGEKKDGTLLAFLQKGK
jgi:hypothetical protein